MKKNVLVIFMFLLVSLRTNAQDNIKFMLFTDLHYDIMHDGKERLQTILEESEKNNVDFIIEMGDFLPPLPPKALWLNICCPSLPLLHIMP